MALSFMRIVYMAQALQQRGHHVYFCLASKKKKKIKNNDQRK
jgi:UDP:flavonoid glycosyltransferase YjiC (YdhE family)